jgi:CHAD domain-containing protein
LYSPEAIHAVRIAAKKLRYAFELAQELRLLGSRGVLPRLRNIQDTLGRLHDLQVLHVRVDEARASADAADRTAALDELAALLEEDSRQLHARFVARRDALRAAIDAALAETASRAADTPPADAHRPTVH